MAPTLSHATTTRSMPRGAARRGFSLLELMLVIAIIGVLASVAAVNVLGGQDRANKRATEATMRTLGQSIKDYKLAENVFPASLDVLKGDYIDASTSINDAWDRPLAYSVPGQSGKPFNLVSAGEDAEFRTEDDINYWTMNNE